MKVLHLLQSNQFSGAENVVCQIFDMMKAHPEYQMVYCSADGPIRQALEERNVPFVPMKKLCPGEIRRVLRQEQPDVIHAHDMGASFFASLVCGKTKLVSHIHNNAFDSRNINPKSLAYLFAAGKAKRIFWVSRSAGECYRFRRQVADKSVLLHNIINVDSLYRRMALDKNTYDYDAVFLGRLTYPKDPQRMIRVLAKVVRQKPDVKIAVIGQGDLEAETKALASELGITDNVAFLGFQSNPLKILHDAKVMLMTSRWEGLPMCVLESLAVGTPIVSTPTDGVKERVEEGKNGFLSDDDDTLAERIVEVLSDPALYTRLSAYAAEKSLEVNDTAVYCRKLMDAYGK